MTSVGMASFL